MFVYETMGMAQGVARVRLRQLRLILEGTLKM